MRPFELIDPFGVRVEAVAAFFGDLQAAGRTEATARSYGMDLLRWFRFLWAVEVDWQRASRAEARDFSRWMLVAGKPRRPHWRHPDAAPNTLARKQPYAPSVRALRPIVQRRSARWRGGGVSGELQVEIDRLREAARFTAGKAQTIRDELTKLHDTVGKELLADGWQGKAASAYDESWVEWKHGAPRLQTRPQHARPGR